MLLARVIGNIVATQKNQRYEGTRAMLCRQITPDGVDMVMHGVITLCDPPHVLAFNWNADKTGSQVTFELSRQGPDTKLIVTHQRGQ